MSDIRSSRLQPGCDGEDRRWSRGQDACTGGPKQFGGVESEGLRGHHMMAFVRLYLQILQVLAIYAKGLRQGLAGMGRAYRRFCLHRVSV